MKFLVQVEERKMAVTEVEVEADTEEEARLRAYQGAKLVYADEDTYRDVKLLKQIEGPWVYLRGADTGFYLDHQDRKNHNVVVFERARGHLFTAEEVVELNRRLKEIGLPHRDSWNGAGHGQVSFLVDGRRGKQPMSEGQKSLLAAPL